jgi:hypothetical protein
MRDCVVKRLAATILALAASSSAHGQVGSPFSNAVSIIQLIATPEKFHGQTVELTGHCHFAFEGNAIYLHSEDLSNGNRKNALWLELPSREPGFSGGLCIVEGRFNSTRHGHSLYSGAIDTISRLQPTKTRKELKEMMPNNALERSVEQRGRTPGAQDVRPEAEGRR